MKRLACAVVMFGFCFAGVARADPPVADEESTTCKPVQSMVFFGSRFHVKCDKAWKNPSTGAKASYFALPATSDAQVQQALSTANSAIAAGKKVQVFFRTSSTENPAGCNTSDCRKLTAIGIVQ